jgi:hypothetical protein
MDTVTRVVTEIVFFVFGLAGGVPVSTPALSTPATPTVIAVPTPVRRAELDDAYRETLDRCRILMGDPDVE